MHENNFLRDVKPCPSRMIPVKVLFITYAIMNVLNCPERFSSIPFYKSNRF